MARILLGSSNIKRFYKSGKSENYRVELATVFRAFEVVMETVKDNDRVIISVLKTSSRRPSTEPTTTSDWTRWGW
jgi:hypothetical protein